MLLLAGLLVAIGAADPASPHPADTSRLDAWGIEIVGLHLSAGGHLIDFRYKVTDADKAGPLLKAENKAFLIDEATGTQLYVPTTPKVGPLRQTARQILAGKTYFVLFSNAGRLVKAGSKVTITIGDFKAENLTVQ